MKDGKLLAGEIEETARKHQLRINDRFPDSGLASVCGQLLGISKETTSTCEWIARPNHAMRCGIYAAILVLGLALVLSAALIPLESGRLNIADFVTMTDAAVSEIFLITLDARRKRRRIIKSVNRLRSLAHIIDAHQLTKDPDGTAKISVPTTHSPSRDMNEYDLGRYLSTET
jgi:hypothetical protein